MKNVYHIPMHSKRSATKISVLVYAKNGQMYFGAFIGADGTRRQETVACQSV